MGGDATFSGTTYQARIVAYAYVHVLAQMRLGWLGAVDDTPLAVSGEVKGPGDDMRIEFGERHPPIEVQAKHGLTGGANLDEVLDRIRTTAPMSDETHVVLALDRTSSRTVWIRFKGDLERIQSGRMDGLGADAKRIAEEGGEALAALLRLHVIPIDMDHVHDAEVKLAIQLLGSVLEDPSQAIAAWGGLANDADDICARRRRRTRKDLIDLLRAANIAVKPPAKDERWHRQLDFCRDLIRRRHAAAALTVLSEGGYPFDASDHKILWSPLRSPDQVAVSRGVGGRSLLHEAIEEQPTRA